MRGLDDVLRLKHLEATGMLDTPRDPVFDAMTRLAATALRAPGALLTLVDARRQWFKSAYGLAEPWRTRRETPLSHSFCKHVVEGGAVLAIADARRHPLVCTNPAIVDLGVIAYLGVPLVDEAFVIGSVAVFDTAPRTWTAEDEAVLRELATLAAAEIRSRTTATRELHDAAQQAAVLAHLPSAVVGAEAGTGRIVFWNEAAERIWGPRPADIDEMATRGGRGVGGAVRDGEGVVLPRDRRPLWRATVLAQATERQDFQLTAPAGDTRVVRTSAVPVRAADGRHLGGVMIADDVTEEVFAARRLREEQERLRSLNASSPVGVFESDLEGRVTYTNPRLLQIWDATEQEIRGPGWMARVHPDDLPELVQTWRAALAAPREYDHEYRLLLPDGAIRWVHGRSAPLFDAHGAVVGSVGTIEDVTERRSSVEQLLQAQKMEAVGRLAGGIAHDFNNLLTAINADTEFLIAALPAGSQERADAEDIRQAARRAADLTRQLLAFSRRQLLRPRVIDANTVVQRVEKLLRRVIGEDVALVIALDDHVGRITADPGQLEQVLVNLAVNARDAMPNGGTLTIATQAAHDAAGREVVRLTVADTGVGMDETIRRRAFEPFYTTKSVDRGTGLGLSTVHGVVVQSGGTIDLQSEPGRGTRVQITFPATSEPESLEPASAASAARTRSGRVLLVEDEVIVRAALLRVLSAQGYAVVEAPNGRAALETWRAARDAGQAFDAVVTDLVMPQVDGAELARCLRGEGADVPILLVTGHTDRPLPADLLAPGPTGAARTTLLQKPFSGEQLATALEGLLGAAAG